MLCKARLGYDDSLDVVGVHGVGGTWGALATGLFACVGESKGLFYGNPGQLWIQFVSVVATWIFCFVGSYILFKIVDVAMGLRRSSYAGPMRLADGSVIEAEIVSSVFFDPKGDRQNI